MNTYLDIPHHPQEPVYVSLPLDTHPFVFLRYRGHIPDTLHSAPLSSACPFRHCGR